MRLHNLHLLGTSHIARQSLREVRKSIDELQPDIIGLELDKHRFVALMNPQERKLQWRDIKRIGLQGFLFSMVGEYAERKLGEQVGVKPGSEMKLAAQLAAKTKTPIAFIDQPIDITLKKFSKSITWKEKWNFVVDVVTAPFKKKKLPFDLSTVPSRNVVKSLTKEVKIRYPNVYKVLIDDRNRYMARKLATLMKHEPNAVILAIIGAGHEEEVLDLVKKYLK